jgi:carbonic anhydrase
MVTATTSSLQVETKSKVIRWNFEVTNFDYHISSAKHILSKQKDTHVHSIHEDQTNLSMY